MTATHAGGGDYHGLPTTPIEYRGARKPEGLPWAQLTEQYVAAGGQVDAGVWPKVNGKVQVVEGVGRSKHRIHTFIEGGDYDETTGATPARTKRPRAKTESPATGRRLTEEQRGQLCHRYRDGESITDLAKSYGLSTTAVRNTLKRRDEPIRSLSDARKLDWENRR